MDNLNQPNSIELERLKILKAQIYLRQPHLDLVSVTNTNTNTATLHYLDFVKGKEKGKLDLKLHDKVVEVQAHPVTILEKDEVDLSQFNIDKNSEMLTYLGAESLRSHKSIIVNSIDKLGEIQYEASLKWYHKLFRLISPSYKKRKTIRDERSLINAIIGLTNVVAEAGRRGPANYAIVNNKVATILQNQKSFVVLQRDNPPPVLDSGLILLGSLSGNILIYVNTELGWDDNYILVGRKNRPDEPGIHFIVNQDKMETFKTVNSEGKNVWCLKTAIAVLTIGNTPETMYAKEYLNLKIKI